MADPIGAIAVADIIVRSLAYLDEKTDIEEENDLVVGSMLSNDHLLRTTVPSWSIPTCRIIDITRDGTKVQDSYFVAGETPDGLLPEIANDNSRIILVHSPPDRWAETAKIELGDPLVHDDESAYQNLAPTTAQNRAFDTWDLHNLWNPASNEGKHSFHVQTNIHEAVLGDVFEMSKRLHANRRTLLFGRKSVEFWECMSTARTRFFGGGRTESMLSL